MWELHGNLTLRTKDLPDNTNVKFGWLFTDAHDPGHYDGLHVETEYDESRLEEEDFQADFRGYDVWTDERPDIIEGKANVLELPIDRKQNFNINPVKCYKRCENGVCTFNAHFWRYFETKDNKDYQFDPLDDKTFNMLGYYEINDLTAIKGRERIGAGLSDDVRAKLGRIRDYELSGSSLSFGTSMITAATFLLLSMLFN